VFAADRALSSYLFRRAPPPVASAPAAAAAAAAQGQLPALPDAAVACILQHVPVKQRLTSCALVCRTWAAAAVAAPAILYLSLNSSEHSRQLQDWLFKHGGVVVEFWGAAMPSDGFTKWLKSHPLQLPIHKFSQLHIMYLSMLRYEMSAQDVSTATCSRGTRDASLTGQSWGHGASSNSAPSNLGSTAAAVLLPQLRELTLARCELTMQLLTQLLSATALPVVELGDGHVEIYNDTFTQQLTRKEVWPTIWQQLQRLPSLSALHLIDQYELTEADIAPISTLQHLQHLYLKRLAHNTIAAAVAAVAPAGLT
jgi:hypothetical protein